jgi:hypothetical protein
MRSRWIRRNENGQVHHHRSSYWCGIVFVVDTYMRAGVRITVYRESEARTTEGGKMKRVIAITILTLLTLALCGCTKAEASNHRLRTLDTGLMYEIYVDNLTGIQYLRTHKGGVCVMVDAEGKPLIWEGEK